MPRDFGGARSLLLLPLRAVAAAPCAARPVAGGLDGDQDLVPWSTLQHLGIHVCGGGAPTPVGGWDVMASNGNPPQFPSAFTKWKYFDWIELEELTQSGTYTLNPLQDQDQYRGWKW